MLDAGLPLSTVWALPTTQGTFIHVWSSQRSKRNRIMETICYNRSRQFGGKQTGLKEPIVQIGNTPHQLLHKFSPREGYFTFINNDESNEETTVIVHIKTRITQKYFPPTL